MNCPSCGAAMRLKPDVDSFVCDFCHAAHVPEANAEGVRLLDEESSATCPVCGRSLMHAAAGGRRLLYCKRCHGMLIPMSYFAALMEDLRASRASTAASLRPVDERDLDRRSNCPHCGSPMHTHRYAGPGNVIIDSCEHCEVNWLDYGELDRIVRAPDPPPFASGLADN